MEVSVRDWCDYECAAKSWGHEQWIVNNDRYCGKRLVFYAEGSKTSIHFHDLKDETMFVEKGSFIVKIYNGVPVEHRLFVGMSIDIPRLTVHSIQALEEGSTLLEFSTTHHDTDSYRITL